MPLHAHMKVKHLEHPVDLLLYFCGLLLPGGVAIERLGVYSKEIADVAQDVLSLGASLAAGGLGAGIMLVVVINNVVFVLRVDWAVVV